VRPCGLVLVALVVLAVAGCGGGSKKKVADKPPDPGRALIDQLVAAAKRHDPDAIWARVTKATHGRLTKAEAASLVERELGPVLGGGCRTLVSQLVTERYGVVAVKTARAIVALPLRKEDGGLRADLGTQLHIESSGPTPGVHPPSIPHQVAVEVKGAGAGDATIVLYLDGETLYPQVYGSAESATVYANLSVPFPRALHTVIAFAATKSEAAATAWSFTIR
jgi:hypothetical protein